MLWLVEIRDIKSFLRKPLLEEDNKGTARRDSTKDCLCISGMKVASVAAASSKASPIDKRPSLSVSPLLLNFLFLDNFLSELLGVPECAES